VQLRREEGDATPLHDLLRMTLDAIHSIEANERRKKAAEVANWCMLTITWKMMMTI